MWKKVDVIISEALEKKLEARAGQHEWGVAEEARFLLEQVLTADPEVEPHPPPL